jgi:hypothetical protein
MPSRIPFDDVCRNRVRGLTQLRAELESFEPGKRVDGELVDADEQVVGALPGDERVMSEVKHAAGRTTFVPNA